MGLRRALHSPQQLDSSDRLGSATELAPNPDMVSTRCHQRRERMVSALELDGAGGLDPSIKLEPSLLLASAAELPSHNTSGRDSASALEPVPPVSSRLQARTQEEEPQRGRSLTVRWDERQPGRDCARRREEASSHAIQTLSTREFSDWPPRAASRRLSTSCPPCPDRDSLEPALTSLASSVADYSTPSSRSDSPKVTGTHRSEDPDPTRDVDMAAAFGPIKVLDDGFAHEIDAAEAEALLYDNSRSVLIDTPSQHHRSSSLPSKPVKGVLVRTPSHPTTEVASPKQKKAARFADDVDDGLLDLKRSSTGPSAVPQGNISRAGHHGMRRSLDDHDLLVELAVGPERDDDESNSELDLHDAEDNGQQDVSDEFDHEDGDQDDPSTANDDWHDVLEEQQADHADTDTHDGVHLPETESTEQDHPDTSVKGEAGEDCEHRSSIPLVDPLEDESAACSDTQTVSSSDQSDNCSTSDFPPTEPPIAGRLQTHGTSMLISKSKDGIRRTVSMSEVTWLQERLKIPVILKTGPAEPAVTACSVRAAGSHSPNTVYEHPEARKRQVAFGKKTATTAQTVRSGSTTYHMLWEEAQTSTSSSDVTLLDDAESPAVALQDPSLAQPASPMEKVKTKLAAWSWAREQASSSEGEQPRWLPLLPIEEGRLPKSRGSEISPSIELPAAPPNTEKHSDLSSPYLSPPHLSNIQTPDHDSDDDDDGSPIELRFKAALSRPRITTPDTADYLAVPMQSHSTPSTPGASHDIEYLTRKLSNLEEQAPLGHHRDSLTLIHRRLEHERMNQALMHTRDSIVISRDRHLGGFRRVKRPTLPPKSGGVGGAGLEPILDASPSDVGRREDLSLVLTRALSGTGQYAYRGEEEDEG